MGPRDQAWPHFRLFFNLPHPSQTLPNHCPDLQETRKGQSVPLRQRQCRGLENRGRSPRLFTFLRSASPPNSCGCSESRRVPRRECRCQ